jgi:23S rRNA pseudouridine1911/1915/1917 synthase
MVDASHIPVDTVFHPRWPVFYADNHLLVLYKPAGLRMQRDHTGKLNLTDLAKRWLKIRFDKPGRVFLGIVHRLDAPVAGLLALARTSKGAARLSAQFREGHIRKTYLAIVTGRPPQEAGRLVNHIERHGRLSRLARPGSPGSQEARLSYHLVAHRSPHSLLQIDLETGRRHQIRLQLAALGCPIVGDRAYGAQDALADGCIALLAARLALLHPVRQEPLHFSLPEPLGWPWPLADGIPRPLWSVEDFQRAGWRIPGSE